MATDLGQKSRAIQYLKELVWEPPGDRLNNYCSLFPVLKSQLIIHFVSYAGVLSWPNTNRMFMKYFLLKKADVLHEINNIGMVKLPPTANTRSTDFERVR